MEKEGKLIENGIHGYYLTVNDKIYGVINNSDSKLQKISLKNCQAIENDYDLDELADSKLGIPQNNNAIIRREYFISGAKTIIEILGDKKFSEHHTRLMLIDMARFVSTKEMRDAWDLDVQKFHKDRDFFIDKQIRSLQQTEWDVTFNPDEKDSEGCLILKRKI